MKTSSFAVCILFLTAVSCQSPPSNYPQWRGVDRDGSATGFSEPETWPDELTRQWRVEVGPGYATPLLVDEVVYTFTEIDRREVITALDPGDGRILWQSGYERDPFTPVSAAEQHGTGPKATPVFCDGVLVTLGVTGIVAGFKAQDGELLWRTDAPEEPAFFSAAASPACIDGVAFTHPGNYEPLTAFRAETGEILWRAGEGGFFPAPLVAEFDGVQQVVAIDSNNVIGVDPASGEILWQYPWAGGSSGGTMPILRGDIIIVGGIEGTEAFSVVRTDGEWTAEPEWQTANVFMYTSNPVVASNAVFGLSSRNSGQFFALDASTGETMWLGEPREADNTAVVKAGDILFLLNDDAELIVARTDRSGFAPIRRYAVSDSSTWAQPAIVGDRIFIKDTNTLALWTLD